MSSAVEHARSRRADDVARHEGLLGVLEASCERSAAGRFPKGVLDVGDVAFDVTFATRSVIEPSGDRNPQGQTVEPVLDGREHEPVAWAAPVVVGTMLSAAARARRRVLVQPVHQLLIARVGVDGGHETLLEAEAVVEDLGQHRQAIGCARRIGHDHMKGGIEGVVVHTHDEGGISTLGRSGNHYPGCARVEMAAASARAVKRPVASTTTSTPSAPHGSAFTSCSAGSRMR